jgi:VCBS repeat-containing protein
MLLNFGYEVTDFDGDRASGEIRVDVRDDVPKAKNDTTQSIAEGSSSIASQGNPTLNLLYNDVPGADDPIRITEISYVNEQGGTATASVPAGGSGVTVDTVYGELTVRSDGEWRYVSDPYTVHTTEPVSDTFSYTITDRDGDTSSASKTIQVTDSVPSVGTPADSTVHEKNLPTGTDPQNSLLSKTGSLAAIPSADPVDVTFNNPAPPAGLKSGGEDVLYYVSADGHTLTAYTGNAFNPDGTPEHQVFRIVINDSASADAAYTFTLIRPLDHASSDSIDLPVKFKVTDIDNDTVSGTFTVSVIDDKSESPQSIVLDEDGSKTFNTNADATQGNTSITGASSHGTAVINPDGTITYTPDGNYSGDDVFSYTHIDDSGTSTETTVNVKVNPVSDTPVVPKDYAIATYEDQPVALDLTAPKITDAADLNGAAAAGDDPERFGAVTVSGIPEGAKVYRPDGTLLFTGTSVDHDFTVMLVQDYTGNLPITGTDGKSLFVAGTTADQLLTVDDFEGLKILPPPDSAANFTVRMSVTEYEVDSSGGKINAPGLQGKEAHTDVAVNVTAVTDRVDLQWNTIPEDPDHFGTVPDPSDEIRDTQQDGTLYRWIAEDSTAFSLSGLLSFEANDPADHTGLVPIGQNGNDYDGSERRYIVLSNVPDGTIINGIAVNGGTWTSGYFYGSSLPEIAIQPPKDFSGDIQDIVITLFGLDSDTSGTTNPDGSPFSPESKLDSVNLTLYVTPVADDIIAPDVTTPEDTPVRFMQDLEATDKSTDPENGGREIITGITIGDIPEGWRLYDHNGALLLTGDGTGDWTVAVSDITSVHYDAENNPDGYNYQYYTILPPSHSSQDGTLSISVSTTDTSDPDGDPLTPAVADSKTVIHDVTVTVTPVAEIVGVDSDHNGIVDPDLTINPDHTYTAHGTEDLFSPLSDTGFNLETPWSNEDQDGSETTYALFTPRDSGGEEMIGAQFSYADGTGTHILTFSGSPVQIEMQYLDSVKFRPKDNYSGEVTIDVEAKTVDQGPDDVSPSVAISGLAVLSFVFDPDADPVTISAYSPGGLEDNAIPLSIRPQSADTSAPDPAETFNITISDIPAGSVIRYDGSELAAAGGNVTINGFDSTKPLTITPPLNSDEDIVLRVSGQSEDGTDLSSTTSPINIFVKVTGVADSATFTNDLPSFIENNVDSSHRIALTSALTGFVMGDGIDGSESLTIKITGLEGRFDIEGATYIKGAGEERIWVVNAAEAAGVNIVVPDNYSGTIGFMATPVTTEREGSIRTGASQDFSIQIVPSPEAGITTSSTGQEDRLLNLSFGTAYKNGDNDEQITAVYIRQSDVTGKVFTLYYGNGTTVTLDDAVASPGSGVSVTVIGGIEYYKLDDTAIGNIYAKNKADTDGTYTFDVRYDILDAPADGSLPAVTNQSDDELYTLAFIAVTDPISESLGTIAIPLSDGSVTGTGGSQVVTITANTTFTVPVTVSETDLFSEGTNGPDVDGSEILLDFIIEGVPSGVSVNDAVYAGDVYDDDPMSETYGTYVNSGRWIYSVDEPFSTTEMLVDITFIVDGSAGQFEGLNQSISITARGRDAGVTPATGSTVVENASAEFTLEAAEEFDYSGYSNAEPPVVFDFAIQPEYQPVEDTPATLSQIVGNPSLSGTGNFAVTLAGLPSGSLVEGNDFTVDTFTDEAGNTVYSINGYGDTDAFQELLSTVTVTTPPDENSNNGLPFSLVMTVTTSLPGSSVQKNAQTVISPPLSITPVTDPTSIVITAPAVDEDNQETFTVTFSNAADMADYTTVIDGKLYLRLDESGMVNDGGTLELVSGGSSMTLQGISGDPDIPGGDYYVIDGIATLGTVVQLTYTPVGNASGNVSLKAYLKTREDFAANELTSNSTASFAVNPVNDGYAIGAITAEGDEDTLIPVLLSGTGLVDKDGSEEVVSAMVEHVPDGYLVYCGTTAGTAGLAINTGSDGSGNTWVLPLEADGTLPDYIAVKPPEDAGGTVSGLMLTVLGKEKALAGLVTSSQVFELHVAPVADPIQADYFNPTKTFGTEGDLIPLNLNLIMKDQDGSETATLVVSGLGADAAFYDKSGSLVTAIYNTGTGEYTLAGIPAYDESGIFDVNNLYVLQSAMHGVIEVKSFTVDHAAGGYADSSSEGALKTGSFELAISPVIPTSGDDTMLYDGAADLAGMRSFDGLGGGDTLVLKNGVNIDFGSDPDIFNIEAIDLNEHGVHDLSGISFEDVVSMTDSDHTLYILGDGGDSVQFVAGNGWNDPVSDGGYHLYTNGNDVSVRVYVSAEVQDSIS